MDERRAGRRLQPRPPGCGGLIASSHLQTTFLSAELHFEKFGTAKASLWEPKPLLETNAAPGVIRILCPGAPPCKSCNEDLASLKSSYRGLHLEPLVHGIRMHNGRRPSAAAADVRTALIVLPDYHNLFHQFGSLAIAWAARQESHATLPSKQPRDLAEGPMHIFMLSNASLAPTRLFWSPGLALRQPIMVRPSSPPPPALYSRVILVQPATETWWWNVWNRDATARRGVLLPLAARLLSALVPPGSEAAQQADQEARTALGERSAVAEARLALVIRRPPPADRRILNDGELATALRPALAPFSLTPALVDLAALTTRAQLALVRNAGLLLGAHGAGLLWNLFLPSSAPVVEILNMANANKYYANHCLWTGRPYAAWQNAHPAAEEPAVDPFTRVALDPFRAHVRVNLSEVLAVVRGLVLNGTVTQI